MTRILLPLALVGCGPAGREGFWIVLDGRVVGEDGEVIDGATLTLATEDHTPIVAVETDGDGAWSAPFLGESLVGNALTVLVQADGYAEGRANFRVNLQSPESAQLRAGPGQTWTAWRRTLPTIRLATDAGIASVEGRLIDATTGDPVDGAALSLQEGWDASVGEAAIAAATSRDGAFSFTTDAPGTYTVTVAEREGWGGARFPVFLTAKGGRAVGMVSPPVDAGEVRVALSWGDSPFDLDLHLSSPLKGGIAGADGTGQFHLWSQDPTHPDRAEGDEREAYMERTDADGVGPECARIGSVAERGELRISVFDMDNRSDADSDALAGSSALLQVWFGEDTPRFWAVSPGEVASLWHPVEIDVATATVYDVEVWSFGEDPTDPTAF